MTTFPGNTRHAQRPSVWTFCLLALPIWLCTLVAAQAPAFVSFDAPDAGLGEGQGTHPVKINQYGVIAGWYWDSHTVAHGFVRLANGQVTEFDAPGAKYTFPSDINSLGQIVASSSVFSFVRSTTGTLTKIVVPGAVATTAYGINDSGSIVGAYSDSTSVWHGFLRDRSGSYTFFDAPDAGTGHAEGTTAIAINASGEIVGYYSDSAAQYHGFVRDPSGTLTEFDAPGSWFTSTYPAINASGEVIGNYDDTTFHAHAFLRDAAGNITTIDIPGGGGTLAVAINDHGATVGTVLKPHVAGYLGYRRNPTGSFVIVSAPSNELTDPTSLNLNSVTGYYYDANFASHGFVQ